MKTLELSQVLTDEEVKNLKGKYLNMSHIKYDIVDEDCDCFTKEGVLLFKFRKNAFNDELCDLAWKHYHRLAKASRGRGASAGEIDPNAVYWKKRDLVETKGFSTKYLVKGKESKMRINNQVASQPIGYYESTKSLGVDLPCRLTHYTREHFDRFKKGFDYIRAVDKSYQSLNPEKHKLQLERALEKPDFQIEDTAFSTFTINRNFQTGVHQDSGDFGFGNLSVLERGKYKGGYFVLPQYGIAIDLRQGDHLCVDVHQYHGNTQIYESMSDKLFNESLEDIYGDNPAVGTLGLDKRYTRISFVFYLREKIAIKCNEPHKYLINMKKDKDKLLNHKGVMRWEAVVGKSVDMEVIKNSLLYARYNTKEEKVKGMYGCLMSHLTLLQYIVDEKMNNVCVLEDDSTSDFIVPDDLKKTDHITYLGGWLVNLKMKDIKKVVEEKSSFSNGLNKLENSRVLTTRAYYIPKWECALNLLEYIHKKKVWKAIDIMMSEYVKHLYYPALSHQILGYKSTIGNKDPKLKYELY
tara:strand:- start:3834 stop:5402 length:1569 start_codon:yes stop_codon:yes gene_type:complete